MRTNSASLLLYEAARVLGLPLLKEGRRSSEERGKRGRRDSRLDSMMGKQGRGSFSSDKAGGSTGAKKKKMVIKPFKVCMIRLICTRICDC